MQIDGNQSPKENEMNLVDRAFKLVDELNDLSSMLSKDYTLKIESLDVRTLVDSHSVYSYRLQVSREVRKTR